MTYCEKCGKKLESVVIEGFDSNTGKKKTELKCPIGICGHTGFDLCIWDENYKLGFFKTGPRLKCKICGREADHKAWYSG